MNKAFLREPDQEDSRCPACGSIGVDVGSQTLTAQLPADLRNRFTETAAFCRSESCEVVYFDDFGARVARSEIPHEIPVKDPQAPLCGCFGTTRDEIEQDVAEGSFSRTQSALRKAQSADARCSTRSPQGKSCAADLQTFFVRCKNQLGR